MKPSPSFTLIELVIVIGILAVLAAVVVIVINPAEYMKSTRDAQRMSELQTISKSIGLYLGDGKTSMGSANIVYVSIPDSSTTCANLGLPSLPGGWSYSCSTSANYRKTDGTGWLPIAFNTISFGNTLDTLPVDPTNTTSSLNYYTYMTGGSFELTTAMESAKYKMGGTNDVSSKDNSSYPELYEMGSNLTLLPVNYGDTSLVGYWKFDEGSGTTAYDASGHGNNGTLGCSGGTCSNPSYAAGKLNNSLYFNPLVASDRSYVSLSANTSVSVPSVSGSSVTISAWLNPNSSQIGGFFIRNGNYENYGVKLSGPNAGYYGLIFEGYDTSYHSVSLLSSDIIPPSSWNHIVIVFTQGQNIQVYFNGIFKKTTSYSYITSQTSPFQIGGIVGGNYNYNGYIDDVRVYNRSLSAAEIQAIYNATNK